MRIIIAGGRDFDDYELMEREILSIIDGTDYSTIEIVSGGARGADSLGEQFAKQYNLNIKVFPAKWNTYGKMAGYMRNAEMARYASQESGILIAFWDGVSRGTKHMIETADKYDIKTYIVRY